jgi:asparagine synthase (glutamine-hydrolysing)
MTEKYLLREAAKPVITDTVYRRQKHPFMTPPVTLRPAERFHQMLQDTLRGPVLGSLPFYDQKKVIALLDELPAMTDAERIGWDPVLMSVLSACVIQQRRTGSATETKLCVRLAPWYSTWNTGWASISSAGRALIR